MSLQVWLPLNGNINNQGLHNVSVTNVGATTNTAGKIGSCYAFDGNDDYISLTGQCFYDVIKGGTQSFSIAMWVYHADATRAVLFGDYGLSGAINFNVELTTSHTLRFYWGASPDTTISTASVGQSTWSHVVIVYDGSSLKFYINGDLKNTWSGTLAIKTKTSGAYYLGRDSRTGTTVLNGRLNDFRLYDHCLSQMEIHELAKGQIIHLKLSDNYNTITNICDCSGYRHNAIQNALMSSPDTARYESSAIFSGSSSYIKVNDTTWMADRMPAITINLWAKNSAWNVNTHFFSCTEGGGFNTESGNSGYLRFPISVYTAETGTSYAYKFDSNELKLADLPTNEWVMLTWVYDNFGTRTYINGELHHTYLNNSYGIHFNTGARLFLGCEANAANPSSPWYNGQMSDFRMYAVALTAKEIMELYNESSAIDRNGNIYAREVIE